MMIYSLCSCRNLQCGKLDDQLCHIPGFYVVCSVMGSSHDLFSDCVDKHMWFCLGTSESSRDHWVGSPTDTGDVLAS